MLIAWTWKLIYLILGLWTQCLQLYSGVHFSAWLFVFKIILFCFLFFFVTANWVSLSRLPFQLMFLKKLWMEQLQSDPFQLDHQSVERFLLVSWWMKQNSSLLGGVFLLLISQFFAGREAMCSFLWCDNKWAASWVRHCSKSYFNCTKQI